MVYAKFGGQTECLMGNSKIENTYLLNALVGRVMKKISNQFHQGALTTIILR